MVNNTALDLIISWVSAPIVWLTRFSFVVCVSRVLPVNTVTVTNRCKRGVSLMTTALYQRLSPCRPSSTGQLCLSVRWRIQLRLRQQILWLWQTDVSLESALYQRLSPCWPRLTGQLCLSVRWRIRFVSEHFLYRGSSRTWAALISGHFSYRGSSRTLAALVPEQISYLGTSRTGAVLVP